MKLTFVGLLLLISQNLIAQTKSPFELYLEKDESWYPSIFQLYIKQYAGIKVNRYLIDAQDISSIENTISQFPHKETKDIDEAMRAVQTGKKVFFFVENYVWGGLELGSTYSGSWQRLMPLCSGFYLFKKKCFQNQGLNYQCGKPEKGHEILFFIMN